MSRMRYANVLWMRASRSGAFGTHVVIGLGAHILWRWVDWCAQQNGIKVGINAGGGGAAKDGGAEASPLVFLGLFCSCTYIVFGVEPRAAAHDTRWPAVPADHIVWVCVVTGKDKSGCC